MFQHQNHVVHVWPTDAGVGRFQWTYTIDGEHTTSGSDRPFPTEQVAVDEGCAAAVSRIDGWRGLPGDN